MVSTAATAAATAFAYTFTAGFAVAVAVAFPTAAVTVVVAISVAVAATGRAWPAVAATSSRGAIVTIRGSIGGTIVDAVSMATAC